MPRCPGCSGWWTPTRWSWPASWCCPAPPRTGSGGAARSRPGWPRSRSARCCAASRPAWAGWWRFRMLQAVGGSMLNPVAMSIIVNTFTDRAERARAIGVWGAAVGVSLALGPVVGGLLIASVGWRGIFWVNIPVGAGGDRPHRAVRARVQGPASAAVRPGRPAAGHRDAGLADLRDHRGPPARLGFPRDHRLLLSCSRWPWGALLFYEPRRREPLLDLRFFRSAPFSGATVIAVSAFAALGGFLFLNTLYLQDIRGYSALHAGLLTLPLAAVTVIFAPLSGRMISRRGPRIPLIVAGICMSGGALMLTGLTAQQSHRLAACLLRDLRHRLRHGERADHEHSGVRDAARRRRGSRQRSRPPAGRWASRSGSRWWAPR